MFGIGTSELLIVGLIALLLFGNRLPETMRSLGRSMNEFKKGISGIQDEIENAHVPPPRPSAGEPGRPGDDVDRNNASPQR
jgi:sec-independent protein translocase protein TatA